MLEDLTAVQLVVLSMIMNYIAEHQRPPTNVEIARKMKWSSANAARDVLKALEKKEYIELRPNTARNIKILNHSLVWIDVH